MCVFVSRVSTYSIVLCVVVPMYVAKHADERRNRKQKQHGMDAVSPMADSVPCTYSHSPLDSVTVLARRRRGASVPSFVKYVSP